MNSIRRRINMIGLPIVVLFWGYVGYIAIADVTNTTSVGAPDPQTHFQNSGTRPLEWGESDHAGEMELCKQKIAEQVLAVYDWKWGSAWAVGERRIRKGRISFMDRGGAIREDTFTCTFDVAPMGSDYFIGAG